MVPDETQGSTRSARLVNSGEVEPALAQSGNPAGAVMHAQSNAKLKFIPLSDVMMADALKRFPCFNKVILPNGENDTDAKVSLSSVNNMLIVNAGLDELTTYQIAQAICDHMDEVRAENARARQVDPARPLTPGTLPHPGAKRYFSK